LKADLDIGTSSLVKATRHGDTVHQGAAFFCGHRQNVMNMQLPSGKHTKNYGKSPFLKFNG